MPSNVAVIADELYQAGVRYVFGQPGGEVVELLDALEQRGIRFVLTGHESAAAFAAATMGYASGIPGVCLATLGPGACNLTLGVADALLDRHPLLAITARTAVGMEAWYNHQYLALNAMFEPITKASVALDGVNTDQRIRQALGTALEPHQGPVYLTLPGDLAAAESQSEGQTEPVVPTKLRADHESLASIGQALDRASRPIAIIGIALDQHQDGPAIRRFLDRTGLPHFDTPKTKGLVDPESTRFIGTCLSASGDAEYARFIRESDCVIGIGFDPVESAYDWHKSANFHNLARASTAWNAYTPLSEAVGDVSSHLDTMTQNYVGEAAWLESELTDLRRRFKAAIEPLRTEGPKGLAPHTATLSMRKKLPDDTQLVVDTGQHKMIFAAMWTTREPLSYFGSNGLVNGAGRTGRDRAVSAAPRQTGRRRDG